MIDFVYTLHIPICKRRFERRKTNEYSNRYSLTRFGFRFWSNWTPFFFVSVLHGDGICIRCRRRVRKFLHRFDISFIDKYILWMSQLQLDCTASHRRFLHHAFWWDVSVDSDILISFVRFVCILTEHRKIGMCRIGFSASLSLCAHCSWHERALLLSIWKKKMYIFIAMAFQSALLVIVQIMLLFWLLYWIFQRVAWRANVCGFHFDIRYNCWARSIDDRFHNAHVPFNEYFSQFKEREYFFSKKQIVISCWINHHSSFTICYQIDDNLFNDWWYICSYRSLFCRRWPSPLAMTFRCFLGDKHHNYHWNANKLPIPDEKCSIADSIYNRSTLYTIC